MTAHDKSLIQRDVQIVALRAEVKRLRAALAESEREHRAMRDAATLAGNPAAEAWHIARIRAISTALSPGVGLAGGTKPV